MLRFFTSFPALSGSTAARQVRDAALVVAASLTVLLVNLGGPPLFDDDETRNAGCSLAMLDGGDWVVPTFNGELRVHKPPLVNWVQMAGLTIAGRNEYGARLGSVVLTTLSCLLTWRIGTLLFSPAVGLITGLTMAGCIWTAVGGRAATPDAPLVLATTTLLWLLVGGLDRTTGSLRLTAARAAAIGLAAGLAVLAKGPVGIVVPAVAAVLCSLWQAWDSEPDAGGPNLLARAAGNVGSLRPMLVGTAAVAVALPWYVWVGVRTNWEWPRRFLLEHNLERFATPLEGHSGSLAYYPLVLLVGLFPWSIASLLSVGHTVRQLRRPRPAAQRSGERLLVAWAVAWLGFFTVAGTKLPGYIWPAYPALAALVGLFWHAWSRAPGRNDRWMPIAWSSLILVGLAFAVAGPLAVSRSLPSASATAAFWFVAAGVLTCGGGIAAWWMQVQACSLRRRRIPAMLSLVGVGATALLATAASAAFAPLGPREIIADLPPDAEVAVTSWGSPSGVFYAAARQGAGRVVRLQEPEEMLGHLRAKPAAFLLVDPRFADRVLHRLPETHAILGTTDSMPGGKRLMLIGPRHPLAGTVAPARLTSLSRARLVHPL